QDTGSSSSDFITNDNTLIFKGTVDLGDNSTLAVTINGVVYTTANGLVMSDGRRYVVWTCGQS
ncbi:Ig-like domain-containing protein, partial [Shewanella xiamenensis]|uniref:Ig-like domain-containing protein n=1 Tax=Shewanella xiamenensis TaxID=332186 RepID=UPI002E7C038C